MTTDPGREAAARVILRRLNAAANDEAYRLADALAAAGLLAALPGPPEGGWVEIGGERMTQAQFDAARHPLLTPDPGPCMAGDEMSVTFAPGPPDGGATTDLEGSADGRGRADHGDAGADRGRQGIVAHGGPADEPKTAGDPGSSLATARRNVQDLPGRDGQPAVAPVPDVECHLDPAPTPGQVTAADAPDDEDEWHPVNECCAKVARIEALCDEWDTNGNSRALGDPAADTWHKAARDLRAALDATTPTNPGDGT